MLTVSEAETVFEDAKLAPTPFTCGWLFIDGNWYCVDLSGFGLLSWNGGGGVETGRGGGMSSNN